MSAKRALGRQFVDLYHGTDRDSAEAIQEQGLHPAEGNPKVMTVAYDKKSATEYAHDAADYRGGEPAVVHLRVPEDEWHDRFMGDHEDHSWSKAAGLRETVPAEYVHKVTHPRKQRSSGLYEQDTPWW